MSLYYLKDLNLLVFTNPFLTKTQATTELSLVPHLLFVSVQPSAGGGLVITIGWRKKWAEP